MHKHASIFTIVAHGVPWATVLQWIEKYGLSAVLTVLPVITGGGVSGLTVAQIVAWVEAALAAVRAGKPLPAVP